TYKSESNPRYHARDAAKFRCHYHKALLLLSSATPSVESYHAALSGRYKLYELPDRYGGAGLPEVEIVDRRGDFSEGIVGERLRQAIIENLEQDRQAILLLNRRGYHTNVSCRSCGYTVKCRGCEVAMTYHRANGRMLCHYCGHMQPPPVYCPECGSDKIRYAGLGTQKVEEELAALFPSAGILRMDTDTTMSRFAYDQKFGEFSAGKYDIMIGTQMVAKGLDFPRVGLVGVLSADNMLYNGDFRSFETAFALLTQVIGRAGRRDRTGLALIQTYSPESYVIALASRQDYKGFYEVEIAARKAMKYPPFTDLCLFGFVGIREDQVKSSAFTFLKMLYGAVTGEFAGIPVIVLDPAPAVVPKTAGKYRYKLLMKSVNTPQLRELISRLLTEFNRRRENKDVTMFVDINPLGML
ncbi:MAG: primosomal protein N', partial [Oscillospiraceae bacterium]|nr:primosomal protein N' [Oscillospiraceae bacterium]